MFRNFLACGNFGKFLVHESNFLADEMYVLSARNNRVSIQLLGKDKIQDKLSRFEELTNASLSYLGVSSPGTPDDVVGKTIPSEFLAIVCLFPVLLILVFPLSSY